MKPFLFLITVLLTVLSSCNAQNAVHRTDHSNNKRASGDTVQALADAIVVVYQDKKGNHWFGSKGQGAYKYDGTTLLQFTSKDGLVSNDIWGIQEDRAGNVYFDAQEGISQFDGQTFRTLITGDSSVGDWALTPDDLWFKGNWNRNGPYRFDGKTLHHLEFPPNKLADTLYARFPNMTWSPYGIYSLYKDRKGSIWFGTSNLGIYRYDGKSLSRMYEDHLTNVPNGGSFGIRSVLEDKDGRFWFCNTRYRYAIDSRDSLLNGTHFIRYKREKGIERLNAAPVYYMSITEDDSGNLWMATNSDGVCRYDGKSMTRYPVKDGERDITLVSIYTDRHGNLWLGTHDAGAYMFNGKSFEKFRP